MTKHSSRDVRGRFARIDPERDVLVPDLGVPGDYAYGMERRHAPTADGESEPGGARTAYEITDAQGPEAWAAPYADAFPGPVPHDPSHGGYQRPLPHRVQMMADGGTGQQFDVTQSRAIGHDMRTVPTRAESVRYADEAARLHAAYSDAGQDPAGQRRDQDRRSPGRYQPEPARGRAVPVPVDRGQDPYGNAPDKRATLRHMMPATEMEIEQPDEQRLYARCRACGEYFWLNRPWQKHCSTRCRRRLEKRRERRRAKIALVDALPVVVGIHSHERELMPSRPLAPARRPPGASTRWLTPPRPTPTSRSSASWTPTVTT